jgi:tetratricopeptide (TPR) repeat protein
VQFPADTANGLIQRAIAALQRGATDEAATLAGTAMQRFGPDANALMVLAAVRAGQGDVSQAVALYERARTLMPSHIHVLVNLGALYRTSGLLDQARATLEAAVQAGPRFAPAHHNLGNVLADLGDASGARRSYETAMALDPRYADPVASLAWRAQEEHRLEEARDLALRALALAPPNVLARLALARIRLREGEPAAAAALCDEVLGDGPLSVTNRIIAQGSLAEAQDQLGRYDEAFASYTRANDLQREQFAANFAEARGPLSQGAIARLAAFMAATDATRWSQAPDAGASPAFLVGFPRSGTTLLEQILATHPELAALEERDTLDGIAGELLASDEALLGLASLTASDIERHRTRYWQRVHAFLPPPLPAVFLDKQPLNAVLLPFIHRLFPDARIILALRDPRDVVLSCFQQRFVMNEAMYQLLRLDTAARYYDAVMRLVELCRARLPLRLHVVRYEDVLADFDGAVGAVVRFLGLEWDERLRDFAETARQRAIQTPSAAQVVRPLYRSSQGKWRNYRRHLGPHLPLLARWVEGFGYPGS